MTVRRLRDLPSAEFAASLQQGAVFDYGAARVRVRSSVASLAAVLQDVYGAAPWPVRFLRTAAGDSRHHSIRSRTRLPAAPPPFLLGSSSPRVSQRSYETLRNSPRRKGGGACAAYLQGKGQVRAHGAMSAAAGLTDVGFLEASH